LYLVNTGSFNTGIGFNAGGALATTTIVATSLVNGTSYQIVSMGTTTSAQWIASGAVTGTVGETFTANATPGVGTGTVATTADIAIQSLTNTFIGHESGSSVTTGSSNVILGGYTGSAAPISATGNAYVVLSDGAGNVVVSTKTSQTFALQGGTLSTGTGIAFPATQSASTDANTLDDYEEGTWTPNQGAGLTVVGTFSSTGNYVKVGKMVTVQVSLTATTSITISASDAVMFTNLPFASSPTRNPGVAVNIAHSAGLFVNIASTTVYSCGGLVASATIFVSITYQTS